MPLDWIDVSIPMDGGMTVWPGDPPFTMRAQNRIADGAHCNTSSVHFSTHTGTHVDAPWHFEESGKTLDQVDTSVFFGDALLIDIPGVRQITGDDLPSEKLPPRVLIKTRNSLWPFDDPFHQDFTALEPSAAERLVADGVRLVGVDYLSVAPFRQPGGTTHHRLLENGILVVEGLRLGRFAPGTYAFVALPLALVGADGAPCRAFIGQDGSGS